ncbi:hypothetical protein OCU04_007146 [Sclerotinia nivalis]|uniref:Uncharacterized protein n=1 Tax=Sclerotinia nivalis TaxID=352851 RepID=A0A9X0AL74_9HELO|nr:hypothetical protein OCU04_007146 [Sclerotinia nivalis]
MKQLTIELHAGFARATEVGVAELEKFVCIAEEFEGIEVGNEVTEVADISEVDVIVLFEHEEELMLLDRESKVVTMAELRSWASVFDKIEEVPVIEQPKLELVLAMVVLLQIHADGEEASNSAPKTRDMSTE